MRSSSVLRRALVGAVMTVAVGLVGALPAVAADGDPVDDTVDAVVDAVVDVAGSAAPASVVDGDLVAVTSAGEVTVPSDPTEGVGVSGEFGEVSIGLPGAEDADEAVIRAGNAVYADAAPETDLVARAVPAGAQVLITINGDDAPSRFEFPVEVPEGAVLESREDGSVAIVRDEGGVVAELGVFERPWARDADGRSVRTRYEVLGSTLVQHVDHNGAAYPVVADPMVRLTCGWVTCSAYISRQKTKEIANYVSRYANSSVAAIGGAFAVACAPIGGVGAVVCGAAGLVLGTFAIDQFIAARNQNKCVRIRYAPFPTPTFAGLYIDGSSNCPNS